MSLIASVFALLGANDHFLHAEVAAYYSGTLVTDFRFTLTDVTDGSRLHFVLNLCR